MHPRAMAIAKGKKRYFTGIPCPYGHLAERLVSTRRCVICTQRDKDKWEAKHPDRVRAYGRAHYIANREAYIERSANRRKTK